MFLGFLLVGSSDFTCLGFYMNYNKEAKSLTFRRGSKVSQDCGTYITQPPACRFSRLHPLCYGGCGGSRSPAVTRLLTGLWVSTLFGLLGSVGFTVQGFVDVFSKEFWGFEAC